MKTATMTDFRTNMKERLQEIELAMEKKSSKNRKSKVLIPPTSFQKSVDVLRQHRAEIYKLMELQANEPETIEYYKKLGFGKFKKNS